MRCLITGIAGFAGRHLAALLLARADEVHGTLHAGTSAARLHELTARYPALAQRLHVADVAEPAEVDRVIAAVRPERIFHLAAITFVPDSIHDPAAAMRVNVLGALHVFAAVQRHAPGCRVLVVGSGDAYGAVQPDDLPVRETCPFRPLSPYAASKAALDLAAYQWAHGAGLEIVRVRAFNHTGPGQRADFVCPNFARQLLAVARQERAPLLSVGDLEHVRDFSDVRDVVAAYVVACEQGVAGEAYNVCSGVGRSVRSILETLSEIVGVRVRTEVDAARLRRASAPALVGSADKLRAATGWAPRYDWRDTLAAVVDDCR
jgi:GDP-4-dehydro-6-deoxy-D-mannose reductase